MSWFEHSVISSKLLCPYFCPVFFTQESHLGKELPFPRGMHSTEHSGGFSVLVDAANYQHSHVLEFTLRIITHGQ